MPSCCQRNRRKCARKISTIVEIRRRRLGLVMGMPKSLFLLLAFLLLSPRHVSVFYCSGFCLAPPRRSFLLPPRQHITTPRYLVRAAAAAASTTQVAGDAATGSSLSSSSAEAVAPNITNATPQQSPSTCPPRRSQRREHNNNSNSSKRNNRYNNNKSIERQIVALGRRGKTHEALQIFHSLSKPTVRHVNAALDACGRARPVRLETCLQLMQLPVTQQYANVYTFGTLQSALARAGNVQAAFQWLDLMSQEPYKVQPNGVVLNAVASACARAQPPRPDLALQLIQKTSNTTSAQTAQMTVIGYNAVVAAAARAGHWKMATNLLQEMESDLTRPNPDAVTYATVLSACETAKQWQLVLDYAERFKQAGYDLDGLALTSVLHACQQLGLAQKAVDCLEQMKNSTTNYKRRTASAFSNRQPLQQPDAVAYRLAISACARGGDWQQGIRLLDEYCASSEYNNTNHRSQAKNNNNGSGSGDVVAFTAAITGCEYAGEWKQAFVLLERMRQTGVQPNEVTFAAVIRACATATAKLVSSKQYGKQQQQQQENDMPLPQRKALQLLAVLKKDPSIPNPNIQVYNAAIRVCAEAFDVKRAFLLLDKLRQDGLEPDIITYGCLMTACERAGCTECASRVFQEMRRRGGQQDVDGDVDGLVLLEPNEIIYGAAISCCRKAGEAERALLLLKKMMRDGLKPNVAVFNTVLMAQVESKNSGRRGFSSSRTSQDQQESMERLLLIYKILQSKQYPDANPNRQTYSIIIRALASCYQEPRQAEVVLRQMQKDGLVPDVDLYTATVSAYERAGQPLKALRLMESMREDGYDFYESSVLNAAFKKAVKLANAVGRTWTAGDDEDEDEEFNQDARYDAFRIVNDDDEVFDS